MRRSGIITLTTDFGLIDPYVGLMKGVIWSIFPQARIVDLSHQVTPQAVLEGGFLLATAYRYFPLGTVHLAVVDPGVGTGRPAVAVETPRAYFVAPDNGLLSWVWAGLEASERRAARVVELTEPRYWLPQVSATFHGRDIFAPVAAHLAAGVPLEKLGRPLPNLACYLEVRPVRQPDGTIVGQVVHIDRFGNCVTNIDAGLLQEVAPSGGVVLLVRGHRVEERVRTYREGSPGQPVVLVGSSGYLEIAVRDGNAATVLGVVLGDQVRLVSR